ncbi:MAG: polysaccharide biosynthesis/export family protein [Massilia sp.]
MTDFCRLLRSLPLAVVLALGGCASSPTWLPSSGPNYAQVDKPPAAGPAARIRIVDVDGDVAARALGQRSQALFSTTFGSRRQTAYAIGAGDVLEVSVWEVAPAALFGGVSDLRAAPGGARATTFPEQVVGSNGSVNIPFAGQVAAVGRSPQQIEADIVSRLKSKANQPQVMVRLVRNNSANVTVVGEVTNSLRMPLTARGERILDALAAAGGVRQPVNKMTLQLTRGQQVSALPLSTIIKDPAQNIVLEPGDVLTSTFQSQSFSVLGATGKNEEVNFEAQGISLAQALARAGGLQDARADAQGVFIFRFEPSATGATSEKLPVIYRIDLKNPATFFAAKNFPVQDGDVLYVSNAPAAELQKFLNIVVSVVYPLVNVGNALQ